MAILEKLAVEFKNHPAGRKALLRLKEAKKDPEIQPGLKAGALYHQFRDMIKAGNYRAAAAKAQFLLKKYPKSLYVKMAANLLDAFDKVQ
jgi:TolA-binding protein